MFCLLVAAVVFGVVVTTMGSLKFNYIIRLKKTTFAQTIFGPM